MTPVREIKPMDAVLRRLLPPQDPEPSVVYRPSLYALSVDGRIWNTLTQQCLEGQLPASARAGEGCDDLIRSYMLVPEGKDECRFYEGISALMRAYNRKKGYRGYTVLPTMGCNARCVYCYEQGRPQASMTPETVEQTIRFILSTRAEETVSIGWFGGEPLLRPDVMDRICRGLAETGVGYRASMISNGSLVTPEIVEKMTGSWNLRQIQVSMDGAEADYIRRKRYYRNRDEYHTVLKGINLMAQAGIRVVIRCNVDEENWPGVEMFVRDLAASIPVKDNVAIYFCPLNEARTGEHDLKIWKRIMAARSLVLQAGFRVGDSICGSGRFRVFHCMADMNSVVIGPDGSLYPCDHCPPDARFGDIWRNVTDEEVRKEFCRMDRTRGKCRKCPYMPVCTSFACCPVQDTHCREIRDLDLSYFVSRMGETDAAADDITIC